MSSTAASSSIPAASPQMPSSGNMDLAAIEQQRQALETQVQKLRDSLKHWQTWDLEYEGLKEELQALPDTPEQTQLSDLSNTYDGTLVDAKEIRDITGLATNSLRPTLQIIGLIDRRIEYVTKNIETISRQFYAAENKLEEFAFAFSAASGANPRFDDETETGALPLLEIHEELDEHDNVVSSELRRPAEETRKILDRLTKAPSHQSAATQQTTTAGDQTVVQSVTETEDESDTGSPSDSSKRRPPIRKKSVSFSADTKAPIEPVRSESQEGRKSVSFAPKIAVAPAADPPDTRSVSFSAQIEEIPAQTPTSPELHKSDANSDKQKDLRASFKPGEKVYELDDDAETTTQHVILPENESPEDAQLRREMLEYHLNEVGSVVAQMDLDELDDHSDITGSEFLDNETPYTSSEDEEEDEHGRSRGRQINVDYHEQMKNLEARLIGNLGPQPSNTDLEGVDLNPQDVHKLVIRGNRSSLSSAASSGSDAEKKGKKRVSFAEAVDIAEPVAKAPKIETDEHDNDAAEAGNVIADVLVERDTSRSNTSTSPMDDTDPLLARRELAAEYYRRRSDLIKQQGGFKADEDEDDIGQLMEERDGKLKKVSRFKAARLRE